MTDTQKLRERIDSILSTTMPHVTGRDAEAYWRQLLTEVRDALQPKHSGEVLAELRDWQQRKAWMGSMPGEMVAATCAKAETLITSQAEEIERLRAALQSGLNTADEIVAANDHDYGTEESTTAHDTALKIANVLRNGAQP